MRNRSGVKLLAVLTAVTISFPIQSSAGEWRRNGDQWQYILEDGREQRNSWLKTDDGKWYHFDENGVMRTGWYQDKDQKWYYLEADGFMASGWKQIDGKWYYLEADGSMASGWKEIDGKWYYLDKQSGEAVVNGYTPDGYYVDGSGAWNGSSSQDAYDSDDSDDDSWINIPEENGGNQPEEENNGENTGETNPWENKNPVIVEKSGIVSVLGLPYAAITFSDQAEGVETFRYSVAGKDATSLVTPVDSSGRIVKIPLPDKNAHTVTITSGKWTVSTLLLKEPGKSSVVEHETAEAEFSLPTDIPWVVLAEESIPLSQYVKFIKLGESIFVKSSKTTADVVQIRLQTASLKSMALDAVSSATAAPPANMEGKEEKTSIAILFDLAANHVITDDLGIETASGNVFLSKWEVLDKKIALNESLTMSTEAKDLSKRNWKKAESLPRYVKYLTDKAGYGTKIELLTGKTDNTVGPQLSIAPSLKGKDAVIQLSEENESWYRSITKIEIPYSSIKNHYYQENNILSEDGKTITLGVKGDGVSGPMNYCGTYEVTIRSFGFEDVTGTLVVVDKAPEFTSVWNNEGGRLELRPSSTYYLQDIKTVIVNGKKLEPGDFTSDDYRLYIPYRHLVKGENTFEIQAEGYEDVSLTIKSSDDFIIPKKTAEITVDEVIGDSKTMVYRIGSYPENSEELEWFQTLDQSHLQLSYKYGTGTISSFKKEDSSFTVTLSSSMSTYYDYTMKVAVPGYDVVYITFKPVKAAPDVIQNWNNENYSLKLTGDSFYLTSSKMKVVLNGKELIMGESNDYISSYSNGIEIFAHNFTAGEPYTIELREPDYAVKNLEGTAPGELIVPLEAPEIKAEPVPKGSEVTVKALGNAGDWLSKINSVTVGSYTVSPRIESDGLALSHSSLSYSGTYTVTIKATGYRTAQTTVKVLNTVNITGAINYDTERLVLTSSDYYFYDQAVVSLNGSLLEKGKDYTLEGSNKLYVSASLLTEDVNYIILSNENYQKVELDFGKYVAAKTPPALEVIMEESMSGGKEIVLEVSDGDQEWWDALDKSHISVKGSWALSVSNYERDSDSLKLALQDTLSYSTSYTITVSVPGHRSCTVIFKPYRLLPEITYQWDDGELKISTTSYFYFSTANTEVYLDETKLYKDTDYTFDSSSLPQVLTIKADQFTPGEEHTIRILTPGYAPYEITAALTQGQSMSMAIEILPEKILPEEVPEAEIPEKDVPEEEEIPEEEIPEEETPEEGIPEEEIPEEEIPDEEIPEEEAPETEVPEEETDSEKEFKEEPPYKEEEKIPDQEEESDTDEAQETDQEGSDGEGALNDSIE